MLERGGKGGRVNLLAGRGWKAKGKLDLFGSGRKVNV